MNWNLIHFAALCAYRTSSRTTTVFRPFQLVYGLEALLPIEYEIPYLNLVVKLLSTTSTEEECFLHLAHLYET